MASRSPRPEVQHRFRSGTALSSEAQRRRIHNAKNTAARHFGARNRHLVNTSKVALMLLALARLH